MVSTAVRGSPLPGTAERRNGGTAERRQSQAGCCLRRSFQILWPGLAGGAHALAADVHALHAADGRFPALIGHLPVSTREIVVIDQNPAVAPRRLPGLRRALLVIARASDDSLKNFADTRRRITVSGQKFTNTLQQLAATAQRFIAAALKFIVPGFKPNATALKLANNAERFVNTASYLSVIA